MSGWLDGYIDDDDADEPELADEQPIPAAPVILTCHHCGSDHLSLRSTGRDTDAVRFACRACGRTTTHRLPYGYRRCYVIIHAEDI